MVKKTKIVFLLLVALVSMAAGGAWRIRSLVTPDAGDIKQTVHFDEKTGNVNLLVIGLDDVEGVNRSDTLAFVTIDIDNKTIKAMSIPRDTRTTIRGKGTQKINHAFAYGGVDLVKETVVNLIGMPIHYYMVINYNNFPEIVDTLGGVDIDVPKNLKYQDRAGGLYIDIKKGWRHLNGKTALEFVRFRHDALGDIGRIQRQQQFLKALLKRIYDPSNMSRLADITKELLSVIKSDIPLTQGIQLASYLKDISPQNVFFMTMPGKPAMIGGGSYWSPDLVAASTLLTSPLSYDPGMVTSEDLPNEQSREDLEKFSSLIVKPIAILNGAGTSGLGRLVSSKMERLGIEVAYTGNAKHFDYHYSSIGYSPSEGNREIALALAEMCRIPANLVKEDRSTTYAAFLILGKDKDKVLEALDR